MLHELKYLSTYNKGFLVHFKMILSWDYLKIMMQKWCINFK